MEKDDLISRQDVIDALWRVSDGCESIYGTSAIFYAVDVVSALPSAHPDVPDINVGGINKFIDRLEEIFADLRERHGDDSVCGLCEYDGAYIGQSGDWYNECPGFDRDDCFKLSDKCRRRWIDAITKSLPSVQHEPHYDEWCMDCKEYDQAKRCCPRFNRVIRGALKDARWDERKKGRWLPDNNNYFEPYFVCSHCHSSYRVNTVMNKPTWNYCPNCAADMRGEQGDSV